MAWKTGTVRRARDQPPAPTVSPVVDGDGGDDEVGAVEQVASLGGGLQLIRHTALVDHALDHLSGDPEAVGVEVAQGKSAPGEVLPGVPEIGRDGGSEDAAGADENDLYGGYRVPLLRCVSRIGLVRTAKLSERAGRRRQTGRFR